MNHQFITTLIRIARQAQTLAHWHQKEAYVLSNAIFSILVEEWMTSTSTDLEVRWVTKNCDASWRTTGESLYDVVRIGLCGEYISIPAPLLSTMASIELLKEAWASDRIDHPGEGELRGEHPDVSLETLWMALIGALRTRNANPFYYVGHLNTETEGKAEEEMERRFN